MADITYFSRGTRKGRAPALPAGQATTVHCLMIPLSSDILLLPNAAVAEVTSYHKPVVVDGVPECTWGK